MDPLAEDLLVGAKSIALFVFGDEEKARTVYHLKNELGLFPFGGQLAGLKSKLRDRIAAKADAALVDSA